MAEYTWPCEVLKARNIAFNLNERTLGTSPSVSGFTQVVASGPPIWTATLGEIDIRTKEQRLAFKALGTLLQGRLNTIRVPMCMGDQPTVSGYPADTVPYSDETTFDDDTEFYHSAMSVFSSGAASAGSVNISVIAHLIGDIQAGQHFSVDERLYRITGVTNNGSGNYDLSVWPPLRVAIPDGEFLEFDNPTCRMRLATDQEMALELIGRRFSTRTVNFIEDFS